MIGSRSRIIGSRIIGSRISGSRLIGSHIMGPLQIHLYPFTAVWGFLPTGRCMFNSQSFGDDCLLVMYVISCSIDWDARLIVVMIVMHDVIV